MVQSSLPWGSADDDDAPELYQERWRQLWRHAGNGVVNDFTGGGLAVTITDSTHVSVAAGEALVEGAHYQSTSAVTLTRPGSADEVVVLRYDPTQAVYADRVKLAIVGSGAFPGPNLTQNASGTWEVPIARVRSSTVDDMRRWIGPELVMDHPTFMSDRDNNNQQHALGTRVVIAHDPSSGASIDSFVAVRGLVSGTPDWIQIAPVPWQAVTTVGGGPSLSGATIWSEDGPAQSTGLPLRWRQDTGALYVSGSAEDTAGDWAAGGRFLLGQIPLNKTRYFGRTYISGTAFETHYPWNELVVPAYLEQTSDADDNDGYLGVYIVLPAGDYEAVSVSGVVQATNYTV